MRSIYYLFFLITCCYLNACRYPIDPDFDDFDQKIVINSSFSTEEPIQVNLTLSYDANFPQIQKVKPPLTIKLFDSSTGLPIEFLSSNAEQYNYTLSTIAENQKGYKIEIETEDHPLVFAQSSIPSAFDLIQWDTTYRNILAVDYLAVDVEFLNNATTDDYYFFEVNRKVVINPSSTSSRLLQILSFDNDSENQNLENSFSSFNRIFFLDDSFNGVSKTATILIPLQEIEPEFNPEITIRCIHSSKELFDYLLSAEKQAREGGGITFESPTSIISNVQNGLGVFGGFSKEEIVIQF